MFFRLTILLIIFATLPSYIQAIDYSSIKNKSVLASGQYIKNTSIEIQYDQEGVGKNESIDLYINNIKFVVLTNKSKFVVNVLPGAYKLEMRYNNEVIALAGKSALRGQALSWLVPHNKKAKIVNKPPPSIF